MWGGGRTYINKWFKVQLPTISCKYYYYAVNLRSSEDKGTEEKDLQEYKIGYMIIGDTFELF